MLSFGLTYSGKLPKLMRVSGGFPFLIIFFYNYIIGNIFIIIYKCNKNPPPNKIYTNLFKKKSTFLINYYNCSDLFVVLLLVLKKNVSLKH